MIGVADPLQSEGAIGAVINALSLPTTFEIHEVDGLTSEKPDIKPDVIKDFALSTFSTRGIEAEYKAAATPCPGDLNILEKFVGEFRGAGMNLIFRPAYGNNRRNNILEYNVTREVTQFLKQIGNIPNRGLGQQKDVIVKCVPYMQTIDDLLNPDTGKADRPDPINIHFESGMFLRVPPTDVRPIVPKGTISRLASIPHGTTINCQGYEPDLNNPILGKPEIKPISVLPFPTGTPDDLETFMDFFPQLNLKRRFNLRIPQEIKEGDALTIPVMLNPNLMLNELNENSTKKRITKHYTFSIHSDSKVSGIPGGGTANIAFLVGSPLHDKGKQNPGPNANGVSVGVTYWVSTVEYDVLLPEGDFSGDKKQEVVVESEALKEEKAAGKVVVSPSFQIKLDKKVPPNTIVQLEATQIQYSQNVTLDFDSMGWPHISVATLSPSNPVPVEASQVVF